MGPTEKVLEEKAFRKNNSSSDPAAITWKAPFCEEGSSVLCVVQPVSWTAPDLCYSFTTTPMLPRSGLLFSSRRTPSSTTKQLQGLKPEQLFKITLTCDCKTGSLAQDCTVFVLSKALIEPFIWFVSSSALHLWNIKGAVGEQVHSVILRHSCAVLEPSDVDGRLSLRVTVQDDGLSPRGDGIMGLLDEK